MEPITGVERISKQRWKLVCLDLYLLRPFSEFPFSPEMLSLRHPGRRVHSVQQELLFLGISCHLCS